MKQPDAFPQLPPLSSQPLVSVLMINYNYERFIGAAIQSVLGQTYSKFELIVCDDGSADGSRDVVQRFAAHDSRVKPIFKANAGVPCALNDAYAASTGEIIAMLDSDDAYELSKLEAVVGKLCHGGRVGLVMETLMSIDSAGTPIGKLPVFGRFDRGEMRDSILGSGGQFCAAPTSALSMRRECAERVFPIPADEFRTEADVYMRTVAALFFAVDVIEEPLTRYRVHSSNVTASTKLDLKWCERRLSEYERIHKVITRLAAANKWQHGRIEQNPAYCKLQLVRASLRQSSLGERHRVGRQFLHATALSSAGFTARLKAIVRYLAVMLPRPVSAFIWGQIYQPTFLNWLGTRRAKSAA